MHPTYTLNELKSQDYWHCYFLRLMAESFLLKANGSLNDILFENIVHTQSDSMKDEAC